MVYIIRRFFAIYIDGVIILVLTNCVEIFEQVYNGVEISNVQTPQLDNLLILSIYLVYFCFAEYYLSRTLGKKLLKLKIIEYQKSKGMLRLKQVLIRNLVRLIPIDPFSIFLNEEHRMWHDLASKTTVVDARKSLK
ncbi:MAG: RDD family protein [Paludibacter sp.]|nr:RDD family protein [Paludibacter sp.]